MRLLPALFSAPLLAAFLLAAPARAQDAWPRKTVRYLVPLPPGGTADATARIMAEKLAPIWGQPVVVENRAGASGIIGTEALAKSPADGYTIGMGNTNMHVSNAYLYASLPYNPERDFVPLAWLTRNPMFLIVHPSVPANNVQEFIAYARANPDKLSFATIGSGSSMHLATELLIQRTGIRMVHVPYKGMGAAVQDLLAGNVQVTVDISAMAQVRQGKLKALGVASAKRYPGTPTIPAFGEQGLEGLEITSWLSLHAPAGLPEDLQKRINADVNRVLAMSDVKEKINTMNLDIVGGTPQLLAEHLQSERKKYSAVIKAAGIKAE